MTQASNLANFANNLNTSGQVDPNALSSAVSVAKGGTGATSFTANGILKGNGSSAIGVATAQNIVDAIGTTAVANATNASSASTAATCSGNSATVTNGVYTVGDQTIGGNKKFSNGVTFNDNTVQTTAAVSASTDLGGIGSYGLFMYAGYSNIATGSTAPGSDLRYNYSLQSQYDFTKTPFGSSVIASGYNAGYNGGGTALSGTWRKISSGTTFTTSTGSYATTSRYPHLWVRVS